MTGPEKKTIIILAGGKSSRMGRDKSLLEIGDKPVFEIILDSVRPFFDEIIVSTNSPVVFSKYGYECVTDEVAGAGPAAGIMSVMRRFEREYYQVAACDMPFIEGAAAARVLELAKGSDAAIVRTTDGPQALFSAYSIRCLPAFEKSIAAGINKILLCIKDLNIKDVHVGELGIKSDPSRHFFNINTPAELTDASLLA